MKLYTEHQIKEALSSLPFEEVKSKITVSDDIQEFIDDKDIKEIPVIFPTRKADYGNYKHYRRFPIELGPQNIIMIHHFDNVRQGMDIHFEAHDFIEENTEAMNSTYDQYKKSAQQFFSQLEGHYCDAFLEALIIEATKKLSESDGRRKNNQSYESRALKALKSAEMSIVSE